MDQNGSNLSPKDLKLIASIKRENPTIKYIVRNLNGELRCFEQKPHRTSLGIWVDENDDPGIPLNSLFFPSTIPTGAQHQNK